MCHGPSLCILRPYKQIIYDPFLSVTIRWSFVEYFFISFRDEKRSKSSHPKGIFFDNDQLANNTELSKSATGLFISEGVGETLECFPSPTVFTPCDDILGEPNYFVRVQFSKTPLFS